MRWILLLTAVAVAFFLTHFLGGSSFFNVDEEPLKDKATAESEVGREANVISSPPRSNQENRRSHPDVLMTPDAGTNPSQPLAIWKDIKSPLEVGNHLEASGVLDPLGAAIWERTWFDKCIQIGQQSVGIGASSLDPISIQAKAIRDVCDAAGLGKEAVEDLSAVTTKLVTLNNEVSAARQYSTSLHLIELQATSSKDFVNEAINEILATSADPLALTDAIRFLIQEDLVDDASLNALRHPLYLPVLKTIADDLGWLLFCERTDGCIGWSHPVVLQRCQDVYFHCRAPADYSEVIYQTITPVHYALFQALEDVVRYRILLAGNTR